MQSTATTTPTPNGTVVPWQEGQAALEELATTQGRLAASAVVVFVAVVLVGVLLPWTIGRIRELFATKYVTGPVAETIELVSDYVPTTLSGVTLRVVQTSGVVVMALALLVVWGLVDVAKAAVDVLVLAMPGLVNFAMTIVLFVAGYIAWDQLRGVIRRFSEGADQVTEHQEEILLRVSQLVLVVTVGAATMTVWGVNLSGLLVGAGFLGIVVGMAARQTLGSLIAGFVLMFSRPFTIGDWVQIDDQEGIVTDITIFNTRLENFDGEFVVIPNDQVSDSAVTNRSQKGMLRLKLDVGVDYETDLDRAREIALDAIAECPEVVDSPAPQVVPKSFGDSAVVLETRFWIDHPRPPRKWKAVSAVVDAVKTAYDDAGIKIPYPQRELSGRAETGGFRVHQQNGAAESRDVAEPQSPD